jgi:hypothetical protein
MPIFTPSGPDYLLIRIADVPLIRQAPFDLSKEKFFRHIKEIDEGRIKISSRGNVRLRIKIPISPQGRVPRITYLVTNPFFMA